MDENEVEGAIRFEETLALAVGISFRQQSARAASGRVATAEQIGAPRINISGLGQAAPDERILNHAAEWDYAVVTCDLIMRKSPHFRALFRARVLAVSFLDTGGARQQSAWQIAQLVVKAWDNLEKAAAETSQSLLALVQANGRVVGH